MAGGQNPAALNQNPSTRVSEGQGASFEPHLQGHLPGQGPRNGLQTAVDALCGPLWLRFATGGELCRRRRGRLKDRFLGRSPSRDLRLSRPRFGWPRFGWPRHSGPRLGWPRLGGPRNASSGLGSEAGGHRTSREGVSSGYD